MQVKIKKLHPNAVVPKYATQGDAGLDLVATSKEYLPDEEHVRYGTGLAIEIPKGHVGLLFPRSSIFKNQQLLSNSVGVIDSGYRGEVCAVFLGTPLNSYAIGDRIGQLIILPYPTIEFEEVDELSETERGNGGYGSTGR